MGYLGLFQFSEIRSIDQILFYAQNRIHIHTLFDYCTAYVCVLVAFLYLHADQDLNHIARKHVIIIDKIGLIVLGCVRGRRYFLQSISICITI